MIGKMGLAYASASGFDTLECGGSRPLFFRPHIEV